MQRKHDLTFIIQIVEIEWSSSTENIWLVKTSLCSDYDESCDYSEVSLCFNSFFYILSFRLQDRLQNPLGSRQGNLCSRSGGLWPSWTRGQSISTREVRSGVVRGELEQEACKWNLSSFKQGATTDPEEEDDYAMSKEAFSLLQVKKSKYFNAKCRLIKKPIWRPKKLSSPKTNSSEYRWSKKLRRNRLQSRWVHCMALVVWFKYFEDLWTEHRPRLVTSCLVGARTPPPSSKNCLL